jgi:hypothetical protein
MLSNKIPLILGNLIPIKLLERINRSSTDMRIQHHFIFKLATIGRLIGTLNLDSYGGLSLFAQRDLLVLALDGGDATHGDDFLGAGDGVDLDGCNGCVYAESAVEHIHADDDGVGLVEDLDGVEDTGEDCQHLGLFLFRGGDFGHVLGELVEEVVDDVGGEDLDANVVGVGLGFLVYLDVETALRRIACAFPTWLMR